MTTAIEECILKVAVGKYGSESLPEHLIDVLISELENPQIPSIQKGALIGALFLKGFINNGEKKIQNYFSLYKPKDILERFCQKEQETIKALIEKLLNGSTLSYDESFYIGKYLFDEDIGNDSEFSIGLITMILRFRYETIEEYTGLLKAIESKFYPNWFPLPKEISKKTVILTDPFDGVNKSYCFSPLIGNFLLTNGYIPVFIVSDNPGPKFHYNLKDLAIALKGIFIKSTQELWDYINKKEYNDYGFFIDVSDLSYVLKIWIERRKLLKKRPFLSTLERIYNPIKANMQIFSAFHPPYLEKTTEILMNNHIPIIYGIRRGEEGGLTFSYNKRVESLLSMKKDNSYEQKKNTFFSPSSIKLNITPEINDNKTIIEQYTKNKTIEFCKLSKNDHFNEEEYKNYILNQIRKTLEIYDDFIKTLNL